MVNSVLHERSPYYFKTLGFPQAEGWWGWPQVLTTLRRCEETGEIQPQLPPEIQRPGALVGLTLGLLARQAALLGEYVHWNGWPEL